MPKPDESATALRTRLEVALREYTFSHHPNTFLEKLDEIADTIVPRTPDEPFDAWFARLNRTFESLPAHPPLVVPKGSFGDVDWDKLTPRFMSELALDALYVVRLVSGQEVLLGHSKTAMGYLLAGVRFHERGHHCPTWTGDALFGECRCDVETNP